MTSISRAMVLAGLGVMTGAVPAFAHAHLTAAKPAAGSTVAKGPAELDLMFSEGLNLAFTGVTVTGPGAAKVATGSATLGAGSDTTLVVPVPGPLAAGRYTVAWHALAKDGHKTSGTYTFTVQP